VTVDSDLLGEGMREVWGEVWGYEGGGMGGKALLHY
jgi:hypothetical protein